MGGHIHEYEVGGDRSPIGEMCKVQKGQLAALQSKLALVPGNNKRDWDLDRPCRRRSDRDRALERPRPQIYRVYGN